MSNNADLFVNQRVKAKVAIGEIPAGTIGQIIRDEINGTYLVEFEGRFLKRYPLVECPEEGLEVYKPKSKPRELRVYSY